MKHQNENQLRLEQEDERQNRFWAKGDDGWFSVTVSDEQRELLRFLRTQGIELEADTSEIPEEDILFEVHGEVEDE
jgi:hypothetical protein